MKFKFLTLLALGFASLSQAATFDIYMTGSTAGRSSVNSAINGLFGPFSSTATTGKTKAWFNSDPAQSSENSANKATYMGGTIGDGHVYNIHVAWSGSAAGVQALTDNPNIQFLSETSGGFTSTPGTFVNHVADIGFSDVFQETTAFKSPTLVDEQTIVLPFKIFTSEGSPITNATPQLLRVLFASGVTPLAVWTNNALDESKGVFAAGRDASSGSRITFMAEIGSGGTSSVSQFNPTLSFTNFALTSVTLNGTTTVTHNSADPALTVGQPIRGTGIPAGAKVASITNATTFVLTAAAGSGTPSDVRAGQNASAHTAIGDGGSSSGSGVANIVAATTEGLSDFGLSPCYYVSYLGLGDASQTAVPNGAVEVPFNGVTYSQARVENGQYSLWGYLHLFRRDTAPTEVNTVANQLIPFLKANPGTSGINPTPMRVKRNSDGGDVIPTYF